MSPAAAAAAAAVEPWQQQPFTGQRHRTQQPRVTRTSAGPGPGMDRGEAETPRCPCLVPWHSQQLPAAQPERETAETPPCPALKTPPLHDADDVTGAGLGQVAWPYPAIPLPTSPAPVRRGRDDSSNRTTIRAPYTTAAVRLPHLTGRPAARRALCPPPSVGARPLLSRPVRLPPFVVFLSFPRARASAPVQVPTHTLALRGKSTTAASCAPTREPASQPPYHA